MFSRIVNLPLHWQIAIALALAALVGWLAEESTTLFGASLLDIFDFFGGLFLNALKMVVVPLILSSIIVGVGNMASQGAFGRVGGKTLGFYLATGLLSILTGLVLVNVIAPGEAESARALAAALPDASQVMDKVEGRGTGDLLEVIKRAVPSNIFQAALEVQLLALIFVGVVFGYFMSRLKGPAGETLRNFWIGVHDVMIMITMWIMRFAPIGVFALVGKTLIVSGFAALEALGLFFLTVLLALAVHFAVWLPLLLRLFGGVRPYAYYGRVAPAQLTAFSTASSSATLPVSMNSAEQAGVSKRVTGFVLPLGATVNMDGTALYECVVVIFIAQVYALVSGVEFGIAEQFIVVLLALLTSIGVAGIPAASLVAIALILPAVGLPVEALAIVLAVDRILDMCRTAVNVTSDLTITALVARTEGEALPGLARGGTQPDA
ncbi:MAG: dicarboxylate/amino acid:cation symporter [Gammaproteobacteria bacterium]|nr:dicarboxylate/amino acid:cation symporter [Gammaproteobacteria bacterium]MDE0364927.1 dicarboxylate/amino acid:cation symporter [Gammaproteobacteria bacterium]